MQPIPEQPPDEGSRSDVAELAATVKRWGMAEPAALLLRVFKPLAWSGGQMLWALQPLLEGLGASRSGRTSSLLSVPGLASLLERETGVDDLIEQLEK